MRCIILFLFISLINSSAYAQENEFHEKIIAKVDSGNFTAALEELNRHLYKKPADYYAYKLRGNVKISLRSYEEALTDLNIYLDHSPDDYEATFDRAVLRYKTGRYSLAIQDFMYLRSNKNFKSTSAIYFQHSSNSSSPARIFTVQGEVNSLHYYYIASSLYHLGKPLDAILYYDTAIYHSPENADYLISRGLAFDKAGYYDVAVADFEQALLISPGHGLAEYNLGNLLNRIGRPEEARIYLEKTVVDVPELAYPHAEIALSNFQNGDLINALRSYNKAISLDSLNTDYLINRGKVRVRLGDTAGAMQDYIKAMQLQPENEQVYFNMAVIEYKNGLYPEALKLLDMAIFYYPEYAAAYYNRAVTYYELKNLSAACTDIKKAASLHHPVDPDMMKTLCED